MHETRKQIDQFWDQLNDNVDEYVKKDERKGSKKRSPSEFAE